jgi:hypothetical protein
MLGGLIKLSALAVLPVLLVGLWQQRPRWPLPLGVVAAAGLLVATYAPFWAGEATLQPIWHQTGRLVWSPATLLLLLLGDEQATPVRLLAGLVWLLALASLLKRTRLEPPQPVPAAGRRVAPSMHAVDARDPSPASAVNAVGAAGWSVVLSVLLLSTAVYAHYLVPVVALAAVADDARLERAALWLSIGALAAYGTEVLGVAIGSEWLGSPGYRLVGSLLLLGPALAALVAPAALDRLRSARSRPN